MTLDAGTADEVQLTLTAHVDALAEARRFLARYARQSGLQQDRADDVVQAAGELMAVGGRSHQVLRLVVHEHHDQLGVRVELAGPGSPDGTVDVSDEGVVLLNGLSSQWGWRQLPGRTQVWCDVPRREGTTREGPEGNLRRSR